MIAIAMHRVPMRMAHTSVIALRDTSEMEHSVNVCTRKLPDIL